MVVFFINSCVGLMKKPQKKTQVIKIHKKFKRTIQITPLPDNIDILNKLGERANESGDYKKAIKCYKKAITIKPKHLEAYHNLGVSYFNLGEKSKAKKYFKLYDKLNERAQKKIKR